MAKPPNEGEMTLLAMPDAVDLIRFEKNLLQIGFFGAHERRGPSTSSRRIEQWANRDGKKIKVSAEFRSSETLGLPSTSDRDKYMAFMRLAMDQKMRTGTIANPIRFSGYSLLNTLGLSDSGENYEALNKWGMRMADTTITSEQIIYSSSSKRYMNKTVHVFRSFTRLGASGLDNTGRSDQFEVELEDWLLDNLNESFVVPEDFNAYRKLVRPTAKGIFVYLYVWFFASKGREVEKDYSELCALLNVRHYEHLSKIRETMGLSLTDLVNIGYLESWDIRPMSSKEGYKLVLAPGRAMQEVLLMTRQRQLAAASRTPDALSRDRDQVKKVLIEKGISRTKAAEIAQKYDPTEVQRCIDFVAEQLKHDRGKIQNPAGYLIRFIEEEQSLPMDFDPMSENPRKAEQLPKASPLEDLRSRTQYEEWCQSEADTLIATNFSEKEQEGRIRVLSSQLRKNASMASLLDRMTPKQRKAEMRRQLRKEVAKEMILPSFEEWRAVHAQQSLL